MQVKDLATLAGTTVRTVRYYHQLGLLGVPEQGQGWRSYGFAHLTRLMRIRWLVESGVPLSEVPHMLAPPANADERAVVVDDLDGVLAAIDERIDTLKEQRHRVATLLERVHSQGRLSPLPPAVVRLYAALAQRPLSPALAESMRRERDLLELACYHAPPARRRRGPCRRARRRSARRNLWDLGGVPSPGRPRLSAADADRPRPDH